MSELKDLIRKFIEKKIEQNSENTGHNSAEDQTEVFSLESKLRESGYDPQAIFSTIENLEPDNLKETVEAIFKVISEDVTWKKPIRVSDRGFISKSITTKETEQGLEMQVERPLIVAACGKVIKEEEIGVKCSVCHQYDCKEHAFLCHYCSRALCIVHTYFFKNESGENVPYCAEHYKKEVDNIDTWELKEKHISKRNRGNEA